MGKTLGTAIVLFLLAVSGLLILGDRGERIVQSLFPAALAEEKPKLERASDGSDDAVSWLDQTKNGQKLLAAENCAEFWNILWPVAKQGDLEARAILFYLMVPPSDMPFLYAPGNSQDRVSWKRDSTIMAVHSQAYEGPFQPGYRDLAYRQFISAGFSGSLKGDQFLECVKASGKNCADIAVEAKLVPSFDEFAKQVDAMTAAGMRATCK